MKNNLKRRLLHAIGATSIGPISTAVIQLVSVPVFLHFWGPGIYGEWLVLSAMPIYLGLTDFGFGSVAATEMTMLVARGDKAGALSVFQSIWLLTTGVSITIGLCVALGLWTLPIERWVHVSLLSKGQVVGILCALCVYILLDLQWTVIAAGFRSDGNYALGTLLGTVTRIATSASSLVAVAFHASPLVVALILVVVRALGNWACKYVLRYKSPWLRYGFSSARFAVIRKLIGPAIAYMAFPAGNAFSLQGMTILVGVALGPIAVVAFSTVRTLTRIVYQGVAMISESVWSEMAIAFGAGNKILARNIHRCACQASLGLSLVAISLLFLFGPSIYVRWTHSRVIMDVGLFHLLLIEGIANAFWLTSSVVPVACNRHERQAITYVISTALSLPLAYLLMIHFGLIGAGISLLIVDLCMMGYVLGNSLSLLDDNLADFTIALFRAPTLAAGIQRN
jgi:O-antigen/teichoic acid export membrane protein